MGGTYHSPYGNIGYPTDNFKRKGNKIPGLSQHSYNVKKLSKQISLTLFLLDDELLVVIDEEGGHGEGDNHAEDAEEGAPDGERQEDDG